MLEKLIAYEAVHEIKGWDDLRRRLAPDRRCFAFFHPALPGEPLIFVEVALVQGLATAVPPLLVQDADQDSAGLRAAHADTAIFYSISNCQDGLRGVSFGNFLIKQVVEELQTEFPQLKRFSTLSPIPGFRRWLGQQPQSGGNEVAMLRELHREGWWHDAAPCETWRPVLMRLCAHISRARRRPGIASIRWRASISATVPDWSGSTGSATRPIARWRNPSASWSTIFTITTASSVTTRPLRA